jgi:hypothetical protein
MSKCFTHDCESENLEYRARVETDVGKADTDKWSGVRVPVS